MYETFFMSKKNAQKMAIQSWPTHPQIVEKDENGSRFYSNNCEKFFIARKKANMFVMQTATVYKVHCVCFFANDEYKIGYGTMYIRVYFKQQFKL